MKKHQIISTLGDVLFEAECVTFKECILKAIREGVNLSLARGLSTEEVTTIQSIVDLINDCTEKIAMAEGIVDDVAAELEYLLHAPSWAANKK